jgi:hypothetical protein
MYLYDLLNLNLNVFMLFIKFYFNYKEISYFKLIVVLKMQNNVLLIKSRDTFGIFLNDIFTLTL